MDAFSSQPRPATTAEPLVRVRNLTLTLPSASGPVNILRGIDLDIARGEALGLVGPSGSGKTSLLMLLAGLERATGGTIELDGQTITTLDEDALAHMRRARVGIVFQAFHLIPTMTALENVAVPLELAGRRDAMTRAKAALDAVGLSHRLTHLPSRLSGGEQQRVAIARACAPEPVMLLADEPTGNLDGATGEQVIELLFAQRARMGTTLLLITHDRALAARCDREVRLADGKIVDLETPGREHTDITRQDHAITDAVSRNRTAPDRAVTDGPAAGQGADRAVDGQAASGRVHRGADGRIAPDPTVSRTGRDEIAEDGAV
jgi:putative ABC transport system ATP-binding protein